MRRIALLTLAVALICIAPYSAAREPAATPQKRVLLLGQSPDGHPRATHEYLPGMRILAACLKQVAQVKPVVLKADDPWTEGPELLADADGVVLFVSQGAKWIQDDPRRFQAFVKLAERGGGLVVLHWGMGAKEAKYVQGFVNLFGGCHGGPDRKYKVLENAKVRIPNDSHPIVRGIKPFGLREEFYYRLKFVKSDSVITPILQTQVEEDVETVCWAWERPNGGRSFGFSGGHFHSNWKRPEYRRLLTQAVLWTVDLPIPKNGLTVDVPMTVLNLD
jgi:type 1 glutamine amidotransferase